MKNKKESNIRKIRIWIDGRLIGIYGKVDVNPLNNNDVPARSWWKIILFSMLLVSLLIGIFILLR